jgi:hypothetical protein
MLAGFVKAPWILLPLVSLACLFPAAARLRAGEESAPNDGAEERAYCVRTLTRIADPVLNALSENELKVKLPKGKPDRQQFAPLEAFGRLLAGMAPWLELGPGDDAEGKLRAHYIRLAVKGIGNAVDPKAADFMNFDHGTQPLVDTAFFAQALLRAPGQLWGNLDGKTRANVIAALKSSRVIKPNESNWLLFSAIIEAAIWQFTGECNIGPIDYAVKKHLEWYKGDGTYGDGPAFHWDYYNSYVIQPMLIEVLEVCAAKNHPLAQNLPLILSRAQRYAAIQERLISPEGAFPVMGRSSAFRFGAFQTLALMALMDKLPAGLEPAAVRAGLTAVIRRTIEAPGTFDQAGWLRPGAVGFQPSIQDSYISPGSLYLCSEGLIQLGLPPGDPFWKGRDLPWTQKRIWSGADVGVDHAIP